MLMYSRFIELLFVIMGLVLLILVMAVAVCKAEGWYCAFLLFGLYGLVCASWSAINRNWQWIAVVYDHRLAIQLYEIEKEYLKNGYYGPIVWKWR